MDIRSGSKGAAGTLSNFAPQGFTLDGVEIASMEGFLQSLKFKNPNMQAEICTLVGLKAKRAGANKNWQTKQILYWRGTEIKRDSQEYQDLLDAAFEAKFLGNMKARKTLLSTQNATLTHSIGRTKSSETVLTKNEFCSRLTALRTRIQLEELMEL